MATGKHGQTPSDFRADAIRHFTHQLRLVMGALDGQVGRIEALERELKEFVKWIEPPEDATGGRLPSDKDPWIIRHLSYRPGFDGSARFVLDGGAEFRLSPQLAEVFVFLARGEMNGDEDTPLVGWRSRNEILAHIRRIFGREFPERYVNNLVHRLRDALSHEKCSRALIQTHRRKGVRLACHRDALETADAGSR